MLGFGNYGKYSHDKYGTHTLYTKIAGLTIYYSYLTPIAFRYEGKVCCCENVFSRTTGKHLNWIVGSRETRRKYELSEKDFKEKLRKTYRLAILEEFRELHVKRLSGEK